MKRLPILVLPLCLLLAAGCSGGTAPAIGAPAQDGGAGTLAFLPPTDVKTDCEDCYEPAVAADPQGRIYVAAWRVGGVAVSDDGGATFTVSEIPEPASPTPGTAGGTSDDIVDIAPWGSL